MASNKYAKLKTIKVSIKDKVCIATIHGDHPVHIMTLNLFVDILNFSIIVEKDDDVNVVIMRSNHEKYFIAHFDVTVLILQAKEKTNNPIKPATLYHEMCERFRTMDKVTIAEVAGRVGGGGCELASSFDMRFGVDGQSIMNQMEVPIGILPGGSGTVRWTNLTNRSRAMEVILGGIDVDSRTALEWGWLNRSFKTRRDMEQYSEWLARRIASFPPKAVANAKKSIIGATEMPIDKALENEQILFAELMNLKPALTEMERFMNNGGQTSEGEGRVSELMFDSKL
eukprot:g9345.t1